MISAHRIGFAVIAVVAAGIFISCHKETSPPLPPVPATESPIIPAATYSSLVATVVQSVNLDSLTQTVRELSGETGINLGDRYDTISTRHSGTQGHDLAKEYLIRRLKGYGLSVEAQAYNPQGTNVIATKIGVEFPARKFIMCAHYDDMPDSTIGPGADDNASGVACVLEAARLLSPYSTKYTVVYAFWDEEEEGLQGSVNYAQKAVTDGDSIQGVVNVDMIGWDANNDRKVDIGSMPGFTGRATKSDQLVTHILDVVAIYGISVAPLNVEAKVSDFGAFLQHGFIAAGMSQSYYTGDTNPHYHRSSDRLQYFNLTYFHNVAKVGIASIASLAGVQDKAVGKRVGFQALGSQPHLKKLEMDGHTTTVN